MSYLPIRKLFKGLVVLLVAAAIFTPTKTLAFDTADLLIATRDSEALCDQGGYDWACGPADNYRKVLNEALSKPAGQRDAYIESALFNQEKTTTYLDVVTAYNKAVKDNKINPGASSSSEFEGDCEDGGVRVSVGVNSSNECIGGNGTNPIYAYLRGIILFMGGAIGLAVVVSIIVAGIQYSSSNGNPANIAKAKERLMNAVIGLVLYLFLAAILRYLVPQIFTS